MPMSSRKAIILLFFAFLSFAAKAKDGSLLWLDFPKAAGRSNAAQVSTNAKQKTAQIAVRELSEAWQGEPVRLVLLKNRADLRDGFVLRASKRGITVEASRPVGLLYGAYRLLFWQAEGDFGKQRIDHLKAGEHKEVPSYDIRILNHWDNLDGTIERGYAGHSLWKWGDLPDKISPRYEQYARANASVGINAVVLNNVNASPEILSAEYLKKVKALADIFRPYGLKVWLSVNFASPSVLGGLTTCDPLSPDVIKWWESKVREIYSLVPDFGGFLVKANSEGQPGPMDYGRSHDQGANMLARALKPYGGIVMWRSFVYSAKSADRARQAYDEFQPLDGQFDDNVILQVKLGPIDFQPREPFTPLFGSLRRTNIAPELQIMQEYLGQANHLVFLAPMWQEFLQADTYALGRGSTVAKFTDGELLHQRLTAIAAVANVGEDTNWTGHPFAASSWYAFGRMAWQNGLSSGQIAEEWLRLTFSNEEEFVRKIKEMMLSSREAVVDYMMPLGLHHIFAEGHHYGPEPWFDGAARKDWNCTYYHRADTLGIGFCRTMLGSRYVEQYQEPLRDSLDNVRTCPEKYLLFFHHLSWDYVLSTKRTLWDELCFRYDRGVKTVRSFQRTWDSVERFIDSERFADVQRRLRIQAHDAVWWRDACVLYFQTFSRRPIPLGLERPENNLEDLQKIRLNMSHHN